MLTLLKKAARLTSRLATSLMLLGGLTALAGPAQAGTVSLIASAKTTTLPDGTVVPMWGLSCNDGVSAGVTCAAANTGAGSNWSPVVITVDSSQTTNLTISLQNQLSFNGNAIPTSLVIVGQVGGGLGTTATTAASPTHGTQQTTWPVVGSGATNTPPGQLPRVQSFATEVAAGATGTYTYSALRPGTYLIQSGTHPSIQGPMGLYGVLVVTDNSQRQAYAGNTASKYDADLPIVFSEIDPVQNIAVDTAVRTAGFSETAAWSGLTGQCGDPTVHTCYPPTVNYSPRYYLVNGVSFDRGNLAASTASVLAPASVGASVTSSTGKVLVRYVNAGLKMHVPTVVGLQSTVIAEDGNVLPGNARVQSEVFLAAGKTHDVLVSPKLSGSTYVPANYPIFDRQLSLTTNSQRDGGMQAYLAVAGGSPTGVGSAASQVALSGASNKQYFCQSGTPLVVSNANAGVLAGVTGANGAQLVSSSSLPAGSTLNFNANGTFTYNPPSTGACGGSFTFSVNKTAPLTATILECDSAVQAAGCTLSGPPTLQNDSYVSNNAKMISIPVPGVLTNDTDPAGRVLKVDPTTVTVPSGSPMSVSVNPDGSFSANATAPGTYTFTYNVLNSQKVAAVNPATVTVTFPVGSGLQVHVLDGHHAGQAGWNEITDYRWIIEEDRTFYHDPKCQVNNGTYGQTPTKPDGTPAIDSYGHPCPPLPIEALGYNFHSAGMPTVATGCLGAISCEGGQTLLGAPAACNIGNGICSTGVDPTTGGRTPLSPADVVLDPNKHYFISIMPGDGINPTLNGAGGPMCSGPLDGNGNCTTSMRKFDIALDCPNPSDFTPGTGLCGHNMGGGQIAPGFDSTGAPIQRTVTVKLIETPLPPAQISVLVYEDDYPLNGENDAGGGVDILANNEPGLPDFQILLLDQAGQLADNVGQMTYDMFNQPLSNALAGTIDPMNGNDACPITPNPDHITGMIVTCPKYESDHVTLSPLSGQAVIANLPGGLYEVQSMPNADRIARGEEWLQTNTLDGGKPHEAFIRPGEPRQFQEFGPGGFHVQIGFANPKIINDRRHNSNGTGLCDPAPQGGGLTCNSTLTGHVHGNHMSRTPDERTYDTGTYDAFGWSACYVSIGIPDEEDIAFAKCDGEGNFTVTNMPNGVFKVAVFDEWNDIMLDGLVSSINVTGSSEITLTATQWRTNMYTRAYLDANGNGVPDRDANGNDLEAGLALIPMNIRYRDGEMAFKNITDANGYATWNEVFPLMAWLVVEPDYARYKSTGVHVVYDAGGPDDCSPIAQTVYGGNGHCSKTAAFLAGTTEFNSLPVELRVPGARYCQDADCSLASDSIQNGTYYNPTTGSSGPTANLSSGRIDPPELMEGWQGLLGQHSFIDFGFKPYAPHENGGIKGMVVYASTRPFDDPTWLVQNQWEPGVANATVNLYKKGVAADGTATLTLVDTLQTESFDAYSQGFRTDGTGTGTLLQTQLGTANAGYIPNMNCPGQDPSSGFFATLQGSKMWLDSGSGDQTASKHQLAYNAQFKCFDGWSMLNQIQPTTYDGHYSFPSVTDRNPNTGRPSKTNCAICVPNPDDGNPMLPAGDYVVEVVPPTGYEIVKEEDKNILMGDVFIAPVTQQFAGLGAVFIMPDQATVAAHYNPNNAVNPSDNLGVTIAPRGRYLRRPADVAVRR
jgi:Bacterial Ig domain